MKVSTVLPPILLVPEDTFYTIIVVKTIAKIENLLDNGI